MCIKNKYETEIEKIQNENKRLHFLKPITYNKDGIAYILLICKFALANLILAFVSDGNFLN